MKVKRFHEFLAESKKNEDLVTGGLADDKSPEAIAQKHGVSVGQILDQIKKGINVEMEHTDDPEKAEEIAKDHLMEIPDYYDKLAKVEPHTDEAETTNEAIIATINEGAIKEVQMWMDELVDGVKHGYGWIDPTYVEEQFQMEFPNKWNKDVAKYIYGELLKKNVLYWSDEKDPEKKGKKPANADEIIRDLKIK